MPKTVTRLFASLADAKATIAALEGIGVRHAEISVISGVADGRRRAGPDEHLGDHDPIIGEEAKKGAAAGAAVGTGAGLLAGMALLPIAGGLVPVLAVGWLVAILGTAVGGAAAGTAAGGLVATLTHHGIEETDAHLIAEAVRRGDTLVSARVDDAKYEQAEVLMDRLAVNAATRAEA